ncbi:BAR domain-containing protein [Fagus crenata]
MEVAQSWRLKFSFRNATILVCLLNVLTALLLLQGFLSSYSSRNKITVSQFNSAQIRYIKESEEIRLAMQPLELIKRVREIEQEVYAQPDTVQQKDSKQTAAVDLSKRLKDFRAINDASSLKALEEWRKRKMDRARQRELEKNGTATSQA